MPEGTDTMEQPPPPGPPPPGPPPPGPLPQGDEGHADRRGESQDRERIPKRDEGRSRSRDPDRKRRRRSRSRSYERDRDRRRRDYRDSRDRDYYRDRDRRRRRSRSKSYERHRSRRREREDETVETPVNFIPPAAWQTAAGGGAPVTYGSGAAPVYPGQSAPVGASIAEQIAARHRALACRLYVGNMNYNINETQLRAIFEPFGPVNTISISRQPDGKSKGFCFVEFSDPTAAQSALEVMPGFIMYGRSLKVGRPTNANRGIFDEVRAPKPDPTEQKEAFRKANEAALAGGYGGTPSAAVAAVSAAPGGEPAAPVMPPAAPVAPGLPGVVAPGPNSNPACRIYVGSINFDLTEKDIRAVMESFGPVVSCDLLANLEIPGRHKGYGFVEFETEDAAQKAIAQMNNFELGGRPLKVGPAHSTAGSAVAPVAPPPVVAQITSGMTPAQQAAAQAMAFASGAARQAQVAAAAAATGVTPGVPLVPGVIPGVPGHAVAASGIAPGVVPGTVAPVAPIAAVDDEDEGPGPTSRCVILRNMIDASEVDDELGDEVAEECAEHGKVEKVIVDIPNKGTPDAKVNVYVLFEGEGEVGQESADKAVKSLDQRFFGGRIIRARTYDESKFLAGEYLTK